MSEKKFREINLASRNTTIEFIDDESWFSGSAAPSTRWRFIGWVRAVINKIMISLTGG